MISLEIYNAEPGGKEIRAETPDFVCYKENVNLLEKALKKYQKCKNIILICNGGSVNSFKAVYGSLTDYRNKKRVVFVNTMDPRFLSEVKKSFGSRDALVIAVSKSGETAGVIESVLAFEGYKKLVVTQDKGALHEIADRKGIEVINHPDIGGRFSGLTSSCFVPAILCGIDVESIDKGARRIYKSSGNALK